MSVVLRSVEWLIARDDDYICPDPFLDPSTDLCNPLRYIPSKTYNMIALELYFFVATLLAWRAWKWPARYMLCLVIGCFCQGIGLLLRVLLRINPHNIGLFIVMDCFVVLSPCAFLAADYILLGKMVDYLEGGKHLRPLTLRWLSRGFIISDIVTFCIQGGGGGFSSAKNITLLKIGADIFLAGLVAQLISFTLFIVVYIVFFYRVWKNDPVIWNKKRWKPLYLAMGFTCICFEIRSIYRTAELGQGFNGYITTHESFFLALDTLPLFLGISTYFFFWPGCYISPPPRPKVINGPESDIPLVERLPSAEGVSSVEIRSPVEEQPTGQGRIPRSSKEDLV
ncbi:hypothetical protein TREMEDRAFT_41775 [Tremella mesenterica DSM 1558]|uniref:uncharacterized protein n=1 Tax=Tremella mesenterica (strain ATCC 24925 / CBS 8224 / DSM 1558 / NBRC 9311 / NRRL Y-6157 / RJB 2259-6 / UBC 559-6) TaxID=578456 RepID=UPI0003F4A5B9|nr:uncharacterized protein TREMEDRAFT_41775 [Tremella mesenterica DSM 1558]EIW72485.1 hypothetical protein TREMEDRAFT_41775 [Tremella mesenterica DSM 1558]